MRQYCVAGGFMPVYLNSNAARQEALPGTVYLNETGAAAGGGASARAIILA